MNAKEKKAVTDGYSSLWESGTSTQCNTAAARYRKCGYRTRVIFTPGFRNDLWTVYVKPKETQPALIAKSDERKSGFMI